MAAISPSPRRRPRNELPRWAGTLGLVMGSAIGAAACFGLAALL